MSENVRTFEYVFNNKHDLYISVQVLFFRAKNTKVLCVALIRDRIGHGFFSSLVPVTNTRYPGTLVPGIYF